MFVCVCKKKFKGALCAFYSTHFLQFNAWIQTLTKSLFISCKTANFRAQSDSILEANNINQHIKED